jgi:hypothetical protein
MVNWNPDPDAWKRNRSLIWLEAYRAEESGSMARAAELYDRAAKMFDEADLPEHGSHFREMAKICRGKA